MSDTMTMEEWSKTFGKIDFACSTRKAKPEGWTVDRRSSYLRRMPLRQTIHRKHTLSNKNDRPQPIEGGTSDLTPMQRLPQAASFERRRD